LYSSSGSDSRITLFTAFPAASVRAPEAKGVTFGRASLSTTEFPFAKGNHLLSHCSRMI
jgi:hypothetical protein